MYRHVNNRNWIVLQNGEGSSMSWERYSHLYDLMHMGNTAFHENRLDQVTFSAVLLVGGFTLLLVFSLTRKLFLFLATTSIWVTVSFLSICHVTLKLN